MCFKKLPFFIICLLIVSCEDSVPTKEENGQPHGKNMSPADTSSIPDTVLNEYFEDAAILALRDVYNNELEIHSSIEIPTDSMQVYFHGLLHVYNTTSIPARDSVVSIYPIHCFPHPQTHSIIVTVDRTIDWVQNWKNGNRLTGNTEVDELMEKYELQLDKYHNWPTSDAAVLFAPSPINILALATLFSKINGVISATPNQVIGDGNDILGYLTSDYHECPV